MRIFNLNTNRGAVYLIDFFENHNPDIILLQEWADHRIDRSDSAASHFDEYEFVAATRYVLTASHTAAEVAYSDERTLVTIHDGMLIVNTYLDASSGKLRRLSGANSMPRPVPDFTTMSTRTSTAPRRSRPGTRASSGSSEHKMDLWRYLTCSRFCLYINST